MTKEEIIKEYNVNVSKLKRNYIINPLQRIDGFHLSEFPIDVDFIYLFIECNMRRSDLSVFFGVAKTTIDNFVKKFNCRKSKKQSYKNSSKTVNKKYGVKNIFQIEEIKEKQRNTIKERYGVDNVSQIDCIKIKKIITEKANNSFGKSKDEDKIYNLLCLKYKNVERQYYNKELYPWKCDFYIPKLDLYIEYQGHWSHGEGKCHEPYNKDKIEHSKMLHLWQTKAKKNNRYEDAIRTWTVRDPLKRQTAKKNNLNWIEFFTMDRFMEWYNNINVDKDIKTYNNE